MMGNQDHDLARFVSFVLCSRIIPLFEVVSWTLFDDFTELNEVRNFSYMFSAHLSNFCDFLAIFH